MENAVVYARYSSHNQTEQSIEGQLAAAKKYAEANNYTIIKEYCDRAKTGTNDDREAFQEMLHDCQSHTFTVIIVWKVDRFGRNREEITFNKYRAKTHGVRVEYIAENITEGPEGVILESVLEGMAEYYSLQLSQNVKRGLLESAKKYKVICGHLPLGYIADENNHFVIEPSEAAIVRMIYDKYQAGETMAEIARYLNSHGYTNKRNMPFTKNSIPSILSNERYIGTYIFKDSIREENIIPPIISKEQWEQVQQIKAKNRKMPSARWKYSDYLLTDKLVCGECGAPVVGKSGYGKKGTKYHYYSCTNRARKKCKISPIRKEILEEIVIDQTLKMISDEDTLNYIVDLVWDYYLKTSNDQSELENITKELDRIKKAKANLVRSVEQGMPFDMVKDRINELTDEYHLYSGLLAKKQVSQKFKLTRERIELFLRQFVSGNIADVNCRKRIVSVLVNRIFLYNDKIVIALNYSDESSTITVENIEKEYASVRPCVPEQGLAHSRRTLTCRKEGLFIEIRR